MTDKLDDAALAAIKARHERANGRHGDALAVEAHADRDALLAEVERLRAELERAQMQIVACGVVAQSNTPENAATMRAAIAAAYRTDALRCVEAAVDREMALRADAAALREALEFYVAHCKDVNRHGPEGMTARDAIARDAGAKARAALAGGGS